MKLFNRSTRDIVISRRRRREEKEQEGGDGSLISEPKLQLTPEEKKQRRNAMFEDIQAWSRVICALCIVFLLAVIIGLYLAHISRSGEQEIPVPTEPTAAAAVPEGMLVAALEDCVLPGTVTAGDLVSLFDEEGQQIPALRYVEIFDVTEDGLLVLLRPEQMEYLVQHRSAAAALVARAADKAALLQLQEQLLHPKITLSLPKEAFLAPGEQLLSALSLTVTPEGGIVPTLVWSVSDPEIATVGADGTVTGVTSGETVLTVACGDLKAVCDLHVRIPVTEIQLDYTKIARAVGETYQLVATVLPEDVTDKTVVWSSLDPGIATVDDNGVVTGVSVGETAIEARCGDVTVQCLVWIGVRTEMIQFAADTLTVKVGESVELNGSFSPGTNNIDTTTFETSNPEVATVDAKGVVTGVSRGTAQITVKRGNATDICTVTVERAN